MVRSPISGSDVDRFIRRTYGSFNRGRRITRIPSARRFRAFVMSQISQKRGLTGRAAAEVRRDIKRLQAGAAAKARASTEQRLEAQGLSRDVAVGSKGVLLSERDKTQAAAAVIKSLEASAKRTAEQKREAKAKEQAIRVASLKFQPSRRIETTFKSAQIKSLLQPGRPFSDEFKQGLNSYLNALRPQRVIEIPKGSVTVQGITYVPRNNRERNFLSSLEKVIRRDEKLKKNWSQALKDAGLNVTRDDRLGRRVLKGAGQTGLGLLFSGAFIAGAVEKAGLALAAPFASKRITKEVARELLRAAKATPEVVLKSLDPRKPENWANIIIVIIAVNSLAQARLISKKPNVSSLDKSSKATSSSLKKVSLAKKAALKTPKKNAKIIKKLVSEENKLRATQKALQKRLKIARRETKARTKLEDKAAKLREKGISKKAIRKAEQADLKARREASKKEFNDKLALAKAKGIKAKSANKIRLKIEKLEKLKISKSFQKEIKRLIIKEKRNLSKAISKEFLEKARSEGILTKAANKLLLKARKSGIRTKDFKKFLKGQKKLQRSDIKARRAASAREFKEALAERRLLAKAAKLRAKPVSKATLSKLRSLANKEKALAKKLEQADLKARRIKSAQDFKRELAIRKANAREAANNLRLARKSGLSKRQIRVFIRDSIKANKQALAKDLKARRVSSAKDFKSALAERKLLAKAAKLREKPISKRLLKVFSKEQLRVKKLQDSIKKLEAAIAKESPMWRRVSVKPVRVVTKSIPKASIEIKTANGQLIILKPTQTVLKAPIAKVGKAFIVSVKPIVVKQITTYVANVLSQARIGKPIRKIVREKAIPLHREYADLLRRGSIPKRSLATNKIAPKIGQTPFEKISIASRAKAGPVSALARVVGPRSATTPRSAVDVIAQQKIFPAVRAAIRIASAIARISRLRQILEQIFRRINRGKGKRLRIPAFLFKKKKLTKREEEELLRILKDSSDFYRPSLAAIFFGITGYKAPKVVTGFEIRPIIISIKKKFK